MTSPSFRPQKSHSDHDCAAVRHARQDISGGAVPCDVIALHHFFCHVKTQPTKVIPHHGLTTRWKDPRYPNMHTGVRLAPYGAAGAGFMNTFVTVLCCASGRAREPLS